MSDDDPEAWKVGELTVDAVRDHNDAVDERIKELERKVSRLRAKVHTDVDDDGDDPDDGVFDLREATKED